MEYTNDKTKSVKLSNATLKELPDGIARPTYDRSTLTPGIIHIGLGNFHRAHQAWYLHCLMQAGRNLDWAIIGAGVRPGDAAMREKLLAQDCLTTLIELDPSGSKRAEVTGSMIGFLPVELDNNALIRAMANPTTRIVSLTVTEGGYYTDPDTGGLDTEHPDIRHDAANPDRPRTAFGAVVAALRLRREAYHGPFTGLSCDNLQSNGAILRQIVVGLARLSDPDLADWIGKTCSFPNSMVDCIVPATGQAELEMAKTLGINDAAPVTHEAFRQWVIQDDFCNGRPDWQDVGVQFTENVHGYEAQKIRILNAGHQILANAAEVIGIKTIAQAMQHPDLRAMLRKIEVDEIASNVTPVFGITPGQYFDLVDHRFSNPAIADTTRRVAFDGSSRHVGFVLPSVRDALASGGSVDGLALVEAIWARMCQGTREDGSQIEPNDPIWDQLTTCAQHAIEEPTVWLEMHQIYGDLAKETRFASAFDSWLTLIYREGVESAIRRYVQAD